ncbi:MAG: hypothetical protein QE265_06520 [Rhodoferax sp.]|nr:hypothetical protein [Rhodoferax sp.]
MSTPALPDLLVMQVWLHVGWAVVLAGGSAALLAHGAVPLTLRRAVAVVMGLWALMPGDMSAAYWLGLAFQAPSAMGALVWAAMGWRALRPARGHHHVAAATAPYRWEVGLVVCGIVLGWALLLDTFAQLPVALYERGFDRPALGVLIVVAMLPLLQEGSVRRATAWLAPAAVALFVLLRLPTGNVFDAVLDPWLWGALHAVGVRWAYQRWRTRPQPAA